MTHITLMKLLLLKQNFHILGELLKRFNFVVSVLFLVDCYRGLGRGYSGNISTTITNKTCQHWSEHTPHRFLLPSSLYPELAGDHNYCRNPGSRAPDGPWCFTTDPNTRWEYCDVPKCGEYRLIALKLCATLKMYHIA